MKAYKPDIENIKKLVEKLQKDYYSQVRDKFKLDEKFYELDFLEGLQLPSDVVKEGTILPTARDMVDAFVDHINISNARVLVNKKGITKVADEEAEMMRKFYLGMIYRTNVESPISPWRVAAKHYALHGLTFLKTVWDADRWPDKPIQKPDEPDDDYAKRIEEWQGTTELSVPIIIQAVNPYCVMPDPDHIEPQFIIEKHERVCFNIRSKYPRWTNPKSKDVDKNVEWIEYWDETYKCYLADGEPVLPAGGVVKHRYDFLPYVEIDSGLGNFSIDGKLEMRYVGILRYMFDVLAAESRDYSISDIVLKKGAWPWYIVSGENAAKLTELKQYYGAVTEKPEGVTLDKMTPDIPPDALRVQLAMTSDIIAAHAAPRSIRGLGEQGVRSGADRRLLLAEAGTRYAYAQDAFQYGTAKVLVNCAKLYKNVVPGKVRLWSRTHTDDFDTIIEKDKMKDPFTCYVEFAPISEEDEYRRHDDLERLVKGGIVPRQWARKQMSNVDAQALEREEEKELIKNSPAVRQVQQQYIQVKAQQAFNTRVGAEVAPNLGQPVQQPVQPQGQPMGGMTTGVPQTAPLGSAQDMQNKLKALRSQTPISPTQGQGGGGLTYG